MCLKDRPPEVGYPADKLCCWFNYTRPFESVYRTTECPDWTISSEEQERRRLRRSADKMSRAFEINVSVREKLLSKAEVYALVLDPSIHDHDRKIFKEVLRRKMINDELG
jgi:hypothetical protein